MKAFLITDDFTEANYLQALFSKLGIGVQTANNPNAIAEILVGYNPDLILVSGKSKKFDGVDTSLNIKTKASGRVILLKNTNTPLDDRLKNLDGYLDTPVMAPKLVELLHTLFDLDIEEMAAKLKVSADAKKKVNNIRVGSSDKIMVTGGGSKAVEAVSVTGGRAEENSMGSFGNKSTPEERLLNYEKKMKSLEPIDLKESFEGDRIKDFNKQLRAANDPSEFEELDKQKRDFVKHLFTDEEGS